MSKIGMEFGCSFTFLFFFIFIINCNIDTIHIYDQVTAKIYFMKYLKLNFERIIYRNQLLNNFTV